MPPIIRLEHVDFVIDGQTILREINWELKKGQHWALLGANGSGKTSLLQIITGYLWASSGQTQVLGQSFGQCDIRQLRQHIGWASSALEHQLPIEDKVVEIVESGLEASIGLYREFSEKERQMALSSLDSIKAADLSSRTYASLSQGEQQRVLIARALVHQPKLLILDEPCIGLDPAAREQLLKNLGQLSQATNAPTLLLVTHHIEEIRDWISHVMVLKAGEILAQGPTKTIVTNSILTQAFERTCQITHSGSSYQLNMSV
jgi:iron complex transport system ATP-binding protein